jgi:hypothetical protein
VLPGIKIRRKLRGLNIRRSDDYNRRDEYDRREEIND